MLLPIHIAAGRWLGPLAPVATAQSSSTTRTSPLKTGIAEFDEERLDQAKATLLPWRERATPTRCNATQTRNTFNCRGALAGGNDP
jgi:hypothetical protein